jgi:hypothetical protein
VSTYTLNTLTLFIIIFYIYPILSVAFILKDFDRLTKYINSYFFGANYAPYSRLEQFRLAVKRKRAFSKNNNQEPLVPSLDNQQQRVTARWWLRRRNEVKHRAATRRPRNHLKETGHAKSLNHNDHH